MGGSIYSLSNIYIKSGRQKHINYIDTTSILSLSGRPYFLDKLGLEDLIKGELGISGGVPALKVRVQSILDELSLVRSELGDLPLKKDVIANTKASFTNY